MATKNTKTRNGNNHITTSTLDMHTSITNNNANHIGDTTVSKSIVGMGRYNNKLQIQ